MHNYAVRYRTTPILWYIKNFFYYILFIYNYFYYDCNGKLANACGFGGLDKHHSKELLFLVKLTWNVSLNNCGVNQGYLDTALPSVNCL